MNAFPTLHRMIAILMVSVMLFACGDAGSELESPEDSDATGGEGEAIESSDEEVSETTECEEMTPVTLRLGWVVLYVDALYVAGVEEGFYEEECIDLEIVPGAGSTDTVVQVGNGNADIGVSDSVSVIPGLVQDIPVTAVGALMQRNPFGVLVRADAVDADTPDGDPSLEDLYGLTYGAVEFGSPAIQWDALVGAHDLDMSQIQRVNIAPPGLAEMASGQVDFIANWTMQEPLFEANDIEVLTFPGEDLGQVSYGYVYIVENDFLEENGDLIERFLSATIKAVEYVDENVDEAVGYLCDFAPENCSGDLLTAEVTAAQYRMLAELYTPEEGGDQLLCMNQERWELSKQVLIDAGLVSTEDDVSDGFTNDYLPHCR